VVVSNVPAEWNRTHLFGRALKKTENMNRGRQLGRREGRKLDSFSLALFREKPHPVGEIAGRVAVIDIGLVK